MQQISLNVNQAQRFSRAGEMLHVVNDPFLVLQRSNETVPTYLARIGGGWLLVGFDRTPTLDNFEAAIPPFSEAAFEVPETVSNVYIGTFGNTGVFGLFLGSTSTPALIEWLPCEAAPFFRRIDHPILGGNVGMALATDATGSIWQPTPQTPLLDQQQGQSGQIGAFSPHLRPKIAPSAVDVVHAVTAANTLFSLAGVNGFLNMVGSSVGGPDVRFRVVHRLIVSVSIACTLVVGTPDLAVNAAGNQFEMGRLVFPAPGIQPIEYGEGIEVRQRLTAGAWQAWTSVIATVDITVIGG